MTIYLIFKQYFNSLGEIVKIDIVECDTSEGNAARYSKLYNLQIPSDFKQKISYSYQSVRVR
jgi:hypothetical protein